MAVPLWMRRPMEAVKSFLRGYGELGLRTRWMGKEVWYRRRGRRLDRGSPV